MPVVEDLTPFVYVIVALVALGTFLLLFVRFETHAAAPVEERPPLITQPYAAGETVEQPTPYFAAPVPESPDPLEVSANLDKKALLGTAMVFGVLAMLGGYFLLTPTLRTRAAETQLEKSVERGSHIYASLCFDCHGKRGEGLVGLPLNKPDFKASCGPNGEDANGKKCKPADDQKVADLITKTVARGRARPAPAFSMPAWAREEGGQLNAEQIRQIALFIMYGNWDLVLQYRVENDLPLEPNPPKPPTPQSPEELGKTVAQQTCVVCHSFEKGKNSPNPLSPNLAAYGSEGPFNDQLKALRASDPDWLKKWVADAPSIKPGTGMPKWQGILNNEQIAAVVAYLESLK